ncbi:cytochrome P450 9e2-like [Malaya genurostris]|uniref:cytochrome P450 9e2-like n=1 Tax=Malaya genurostris TaxID=325434 RepID=UPI0026F3AAFB|nr:cytochrome P450 9e2-like [Malaya genurostris]
MEVSLFAAIAIGSLVLFVYRWVSKKYEYFLSKPIPCIKPTFLLGSSAPVIFRTKTLKSHIGTLYNTYPQCRIVGFYELMRPVFMLRDATVIKKIAVKDFDFFMDHSPSISNAPPDGEVGGETLFGNSLFALRGQKWRDMRSTLNPAFKGNKMTNDKFSITESSSPCCAK